MEAWDAECWKGGVVGRDSCHMPLRTPAIPSSAAQTGQGGSPTNLGVDGDVLPSKATWRQLERIIQAQLRDTLRPWMHPQQCVPRPALGSKNARTAILSHATKARRAAFDNRSAGTGAPSICQSIGPRCSRRQERSRCQLTAGRGSSAVLHVRLAMPTWTLRLPHLCKANGQDADGARHRSEQPRGGTKGWSGGVHPHTQYVHLRSRLALGTMRMGCMRPSRGDCAACGISANPDVGYVSIAEAHN
ncbi:hypothetical protein BS50DRAFT_274794 [Corynespora cassiicola Philippines]|uniref:Uncharacterized protein n=1 Tax=Corynespora cassiicola Philippines TaxID=1448308 RepID=A0A2T2P0I9_CORCC|nr:hypothetical protein BS50DRAFT_274794 [Corynespora cassiicola Philippines]